MLKTLMGALALILAAPVAAQAQPAADPHAGHAEHGQQSGEEQQRPDHSGHGEHMMDCCKDCCDKAGQESGNMSCCDKHGDAAPDGAADHSQHAN